MENVIIDDKERRELRALVKQIKGESCVLVLGPRIAKRPSDHKGRTLSEILAGELTAGLNKAADPKPLSLFEVAELHYNEYGSRSRLEVEVEEFYAQDRELTTEFHRDIAELPFRLCISASPDSLMLTAFTQTEAKKRPQVDFYSFQPTKRKNKAQLLAPNVQEPLIYYLFGHHQEGASLILREADLIDYIVQVVKGEPPIPDEVRSILRDPYTSFLFLGFGFHNWYLRVLLKVLDVYGPRDKIAFEDDDFFDLAEGQHAIAFFSGDRDRRIEFRHLRWETFARQLRHAYQESLISSHADEAITKVTSAAFPPESAPLAFLSYASEDVEAVEDLARKLQLSGVRVWQDKQNLRAGDRWNEVLLAVIKTKVDYVIVVQTLAMTAAISGVFRREIEAAQEKHADMGEFKEQRLRFLIPTTVGSLPLLSSLKGLHGIDISKADGVSLLVQSIQEDWEKRAKLRALQRGAP